MRCGRSRRDTPGHGAAPLGSTPPRQRSSRRSNRPASMPCCSRAPRSPRCSTGRRASAATRTPICSSRRRLDAAEEALAALGYQSEPAHRWREPGGDDVGGVVHSHHGHGPIGRRVDDRPAPLAGPGPRSRRRPLEASLRGGRGSRWAVGARRSSTAGGRRCTWPCTLPSTALRTAAARRARAGARALAGRRWDGAAELAGRSARHRRSRPACACCRGVPRRPAPRAAVDGRAGLEDQAPGTRPRGTFHVQALVEADGLRERLGILRRALLPSERGSCSSIRGRGRAGGWGLSPPTQGIWRERPPGPPALGVSGARPGAPAGSADAARQGPGQVLVGPGRAACRTSP